jgi:hypothetical protein
MNFYRLFERNWSIFYMYGNVRLVLYNYMHEETAKYQRSEWNFLTWIDYSQVHCSWKWQKKRTIFKTSKVFIVKFAHCLVYLAAPDIKSD